MSSGLPTVLFVVVPAQMGGSNRSVVTLLKSLEGRVHRVLASPSYGDFRDAVVAEGLADEFVDLPRKPGSPLDRALRVLGGLKIASWVVRNRGRVKAIHANALTGLNLALPGSLLTKAPTVVWIHDPVGSAWGRRLGPWVKRLLPRLRIAAVSRTAETVAVENGLCSEGDANLVPNPISADEVLATGHASDAQTLSIGILGGASHRKGFDLLPEIVSDLQELPVRWLLYVSDVVEPDMEDTWAKLEMMPDGLVERSRKVVNVADAYARLDIVFCPSRSESFCRVAAEAMLNGLPVVASDIQPLRDLLGENEAGILFPTGDGQAASDALATMIADPDLRKKMGQAGKERSASFQPEGIADQLVALYGITG